MSKGAHSFRPLVQRLGGRALLTPVVAAIIAILSAATAIVAAHRNLFIDIAAYSAGLGAAAIVSTVIGGGTSLTYVTGDFDARLAVRAVRTKFIAPTLALTAIVVGAALHQQNQHLPLYSLVLGGLTIMLNQLGELEAASLQRQGRITTWTVIATGSRLVSLAAIFLGTRYSIAMTFGSFIFLLTLIAATRKDHEFRDPKPPLRMAMRRAYFPSHSLISVLEVVIVRLPFLIAPMLTSAAAAGAFAILLSATQSVSGLITSTLYSVMTMRGHRTDAQHASRPLRNMEMLVLASSVPVALIGAATTNAIIKIFNLSDIQSSDTIWLLLIVALPAVALNRAAQYRFLTQQRGDVAAYLLGSISISCVLVSLLSLWQRSVLTLSLGSLIPEGVGLMAFACYRMYRSGHQAVERVT